MDVGLSNLLSVNVRLSLDFLMDIGLSRDLNLSLSGLIMDIGLSLALLVDIGFSLDILVDIGFSLDLLVCVSLGDGVNLRVGYRGIVGVSVQTSDGGNIGSNRLRGVGVSRGCSGVSICVGVGVCAAIVGSRQNSSRC